LQSGSRWRGGRRVLVRCSAICVVAISFVGDVKRGGVGEPDPEGERCRVLDVCPRSCEALEHAHVVGDDALGWQERGIVEDRRRGQGGR
jgi:hypothetical protein